MSTKAEVTNIATEFADFPIEAFVVKAAQKALQHVAKTNNLLGNEISGITPFEQSHI